MYFYETIRHQLKYQHTFVPIISNRHSKLCGGKYSINGLDPSWHCRIQKKYWNGTVAKVRAWNTENYWKSWTDSVLVVSSWLLDWFYHDVIDNCKVIKVNVIKPVGDKYVNLNMMFCCGFYYNCHGLIE